MSQFKIMPVAHDDLAEIRESLCKVAGRRLAARVVGERCDAAVKVAGQPNLGHARPDLSKDPILFFLVCQ